jgi:hypothetical protein
MYDNRRDKDEDKTALRQFVPREPEDIKPKIAAGNRVGQAERAALQDSVLELPRVRKIVFFSPVRHRLIEYDLMNAHCRP